ncbi:MAG: DUF1376 domain-containing protein, partial [Vicinamibacterales bacterium]
DADPAPVTAARVTGTADPTPTNRAPAFQFYPNDFPSDANVIVMSLAERGAYITLLYVCWQQGSLPNDPTRLARLCGASATAFRRMWSTLWPSYHQREDGQLVIPRLEKERERQAEFRRMQSEKGKASGAIRGARCRNRGSVAVEPEGNRGSVSVEPDTRPDMNSSIFDLHTADSPSTALARGTARASTGLGSDPATGSHDAAHDAADGAPSESAAPARLVGRGATQGAGAGGGAYPREHLRCAHLCGRVCLPDNLFAELVRARGGPPEDAERQVREWQARVNAASGEDGPNWTHAVGDDKFAFWRARWQNEHGTTATATPPERSMFAPGTSTPQLAAALREGLAADAEKAERRRKAQQSR